jgi:HlyD family secretion protein
MQPISHPAPLARRRLARRVISTITLACLAAGGWFAWAHFRGGPTPTTYTTVEATQGDVIQSVTASGTLSPVVTVEVGSQTSGRIAELLVDYNSEVKAGQVIARLDPQITEGAVAQARARLSSARADLTRAQATLTNAKQTYERTVALEQAGSVATADVEAALAAKRSAEASVVAAKAGITEATASLKQADVNLAYTTITSPIDGVVISRSVDVGQTVAASLSAPVLFVIAEDLRKMEVHTSVAESDVGQLAAGMKVEFTVDAYPEDTFTGTVKQVRYEATTVSNVVTYDAVVEVTNDQLKLRPGMTANVTFVVADARDVLTVPSKALRYRPATAKKPERSERGKRDRKSAAVWVLRDNVPVRVAVQTGLTDGTTTAVTSDELAPGDLVITGDSTAKKATTQTQGQGGNNRGSRGGGRPPSPF